MAVEEREGAFLRRLRWAAPGLGLLLLVAAGAGWFIGPWESPGTEEASLTQVAAATLIPDSGATAAVAPAPTDDAVALGADIPDPDVDPAPMVEPLDLGLPVAAATAVPEAEAGVALAAEAPDPPILSETVGDPVEPAIDPPPPAPVRSIPAPPAPAPRAGVTAYVVAPGDTLSGIAARLGVSVEAMRAANGLDASGSIRAGQRLVIPAERRGAALASRQITAPTPTPTPKPATKRPTPKPTPRPR